MSRLYPLVLGAAKLTVKMFYHYSVYGLENFISGPALLCPNHASYLDPILVAISSPEPIHFLGKSDLFKLPLFGKFISALNCHQISKGKENLDTLKTIFQVLKNESKIFMAPEGTRTKNGEIQRGMEGVGYVVLKSGCPVIPIYIDGTYNIWGRQHKLPKFCGHVSCVFGKALYFDEFFKNPGKETRVQIVNHIIEKIKAIKQWFSEGKEGDIP